MSLGYLKSTYTFPQLEKNCYNQYSLQQAQGLKFK